MVIDYFNFVILPVLIFLARIADVSIGTIRLIFISKGLKGLAPVLGFFEVLIWLIAVKQIMTDITHPILYIAYATGFATGTYVGMILEEKLSVGKVLIRITTEKDATHLINSLKKEYSLTTIDGKGKNKKVKVILLIIDRKDMNNLVSKLKKFDKNIFYSVEDVRFARDNYKIPTKKNSLNFLRKFK